ncbi:MAG: alpha/beta hydrolase family protein, partial [Solirubrobacterales bacterium]
SGGGAYSWWIAAIDERIKAAVPVAGITDLQNHVVDGCVEGHCDCMFIVNTYRWDYPLVAALVAPRPLLISNSDKDDIFPLDGVLRVHQKVRDIYRLYGAEDKLGLQITEGPHKDTQELRIHAFVWFNRFLKGEDPAIGDPAESCLEPEQLRVFKELPADEVNTKIQERFVPMASAAAAPQTSQDWTAMRDGWMKALREKVFRGWPSEREAGPLDIDRIFSADANGIRLTAYEYTSQPHARLRLFRVESSQNDRDTTRVRLNVLDEAGWTQWLAAMRCGFEKDLSGYSLPEPNRAAFEAMCAGLEADKCATIYLCPRGIGPDAWTGDKQKQTQIQRRFMLLGQTADGMRVWDVRRAIAVIKQSDAAKASVTIAAQGNTAGIALYASLFGPGVDRLDLVDLPQTHAEGPIFLNVLRYMDLPQAVALAAEHTCVQLHTETAAPWQFPQAVATGLGWDGNHLSIDAPAESQASQ